MRLYLVHCGFYEGEGIYEGHTNFFVAAPSFEQARIRVKEKVEFKVRRMHVDGMQEIEAVQGFRVALLEDNDLAERSIVNNLLHRDLGRHLDAQLK